MAMIKQLLAKPDIENVTNEDETNLTNRSTTRKKRGLHDFENAIDSLKYSVSQKKKCYAGNVVKFPKSCGAGGIGQPEDADDEVLIRETQAALKSLSGNWSDTRSSLYKLNNDQEVEFPNLFDVKNSASYQEYEISSNGTEVTYIKTENNNCIYDAKELQMGKEADMIYHQSRKALRHAFVDPVKNVNSAFKPLENLNKKSEHYEQYESNESQYLSPQDNNNHHHNHSMMHEQMDSPDSKQYTVLQPAGIGSRAASVMKDIQTREGFISVSAVTSTSETTPPNNAEQANSTFDHSATTPGKGKQLFCIL